MQTNGNPSDLNLVVARFANGQVMKGSTRDFHPDRTQFHVLAKGAAAGVPVKVSELKAVFFVRDLVGNRIHNKNRKFPAVDQGPQSGRRIAVLFKDGELLVGNALTYSLDKPGFFVTPADPAGNNVRVYVVRSAVSQVKLGPDAEKLALSAPKPASKFKPPAAA